MEKMEFTKQVRYAMYRLSCDATNECIIVVVIVIVVGKIVFVLYYYSCLLHQGVNVYSLVERNVSKTLPVLRDAVM